MEVWDLYDRQRNIISEHVRGNEMPENGYHLVVHVWVHSSDGKYLMSQRSRSKSPLSAYVGMRFSRVRTAYPPPYAKPRKRSDLLFFKRRRRASFTCIRDTVNGKRINDIVDVWLFRYDSDIPLDKATADEVEDAKWMSKEEIAALCNEGMLVTSIKDLGYSFEKMN